MAKKITCDKCGCKDLSPIYNKPPTDDGLWWYRCADCKHVFAGEISKMIKRRLCNVVTNTVTYNIAETSA